MSKVKFHYNGAFDFDVDTNKDVDVYIDKIVMQPLVRNNIRIIILEEPRKGRLYKAVTHYRGRFSFILTFHRELLKRCLCARKFLMMKPWIINYISPNKEFSISTVVGGKSHKDMEGYALRHNLWHNRNHIEKPRKFYLSGNAAHWHTFIPWNGADYDGQLVLGISKEPLFDSMFHIAIESTSIHNYFSEKLLDCFQSRTVPIYYGCCNIADYFNPKGILQAYSLEDIISISNSVTPELYEEMKPYMEENFEKAQAWNDPKQQVEDAIKQLLAEI